MWRYNPVPASTVTWSSSFNVSLFSCKEPSGHCELILTDHLCKIDLGKHAELQTDNLVHHLLRTCVQGHPEEPCGGLREIFSLVSALAEYSVGRAVWGVPGGHKEALLEKVLPGVDLEVLKACAIPSVLAASLRSRCELSAVLSPCLLTATLPCHDGDGFLLLWTRNPNKPSHEWPRSRCLSTAMEKQ